MSEFQVAESRLLARYVTNLDRPVFALQNLPEVVKGALFSRYSRTEKSLRRVLVDEFLAEPGVVPAAPDPDPLVDQGRAEDFYERVLVGYGDDSVAELAGAHVAVEEVSMLAAKAVEDSRLGLSPLEKSTRYVRFDRRRPDGSYPYHRGPELDNPLYAAVCDGLFSAYAGLADRVLMAVRERYPQMEGETERAWKSATRAHALDLVRGLLPAAALTNLGLYGNGRAYEYLLTKLTASGLPECNRLAMALHRELSQVIPAFVKRAVDEKYGRPAAERLRAQAQALAELAPAGTGGPAAAGVTLLEHDPEAEAKVAAGALYPYAGVGWGELRQTDLDPGPVLDALPAGRANRRQRLPRALEHAVYAFEVVGNFAAYRDLHRHRVLTQDRQLLGPELGADVPAELTAFGLQGAFTAAVEAAAAAHAELARRHGRELAQYAVPMACRVRWVWRLNLREVCHLTELRTQPQGHPDYRRLAQEMLTRVAEVHPRLAALAQFADLGPGDELERRASERRIDEKLSALAQRG